jgi:ribosomal-protein-alanine N-acetyltransferase
VKFSIRPLTGADAEAMVSWRYDPPYAAYDPPADLVETFVDPVSRYFAVDAEPGGLAGFCCFGEHARVPGCDYDSGEPDVIDVGVGLRPDMTGRGFGRAFVAAVADFAVQRLGAALVRAAIAECNRRSIRVFEAVGFEVARQLRPPGSGESFLELTRPK